MQSDNETLFIPWAFSLASNTLSFQVYPYDYFKNWDRLSVKVYQFPGWRFRTLHFYSRLHTDEGRKVNLNCGNQYENFQQFYAC